MTKRVLGNRIARSASILGVLAAAACSPLGEPAWPEPVPLDALGSTFTRDELEVDIDAAIASIEAIHPDPYARASRDEIHAAKQRALAGVDEPMTRREFAPRFARFLATYGDGHTNAWFPREDFRKYATTGGRFLPFDLREDGGTIRIGALYEDVHDLAVGDRVVAIGGEPIEAWLDRLCEARSGPRQWRRTGVAENFRTAMWLDGNDPTVEVEWEKPDGRRVKRWLQGIIWHEREASRGTNWDFAVLDGSVAYIDFRSMDDREAWQAFLATTFERIRNEGLRGLIVDLRKNGGGDSQLGNDLIDYITEKPYRMSARKDWKASDEFRAFLKTRLSPAIRWLPLQWVHPMGRALYGADTGEIVAFESEMATPVPADDMPLRFHGPVVLLIGPLTFSSALMTADAIATYDLATVMGEETSECPTGYGEVMGLSLSNTRLAYQLSSARFVRASGDLEDQGGVRPDIEVVADLNDIVKGVDTVLERAKRFVLERR